MFAYCSDNPVNLIDEDGEIGGVDDAIISSVAVLIGLVFIAALYSATPAGQSALDGLIIHAEKAYEKARKVVISVVENASVDEKEIRDQSVYVMRDQNNTVAYVGRTNNPARRQQEHRRDISKKDLKPLEVVQTGLSKKDAMLLEQLLISSYALENLLNARREIAASKINGYRQSLNNVARLIGSVTEEALYHLIRGD